MTTSATITGVRVFNGEGLDPVTAVHVVNGRFTDAVGDDAVEFDGGGAALLPGLIDAHVHVAAVDHLVEEARAGVTTVLDMGAPDRARLDALRHRPGLPDIRSALAPASAPGAFPTTHMGYDPATALTGPESAAQFIDDRVAEGADFIKIIVEDPRVPPHAALDGDTVRAVADAARKQGRLSIAHATSLTAARTAVDAGVDVLTHAPLDRPINAELAQRIAAAGIVVVPTLVMMRGVAGRVAAARPGAVDYAHAVASVTALHEAGVSIVAGTDSNAAPGSVNAVAHGTSLHTELGLLVDAGLTPVQALRAAGILAAETFGPTDRGRIKPGQRADFILVDGDPTLSIAASRAIRAVWIGGDQIQ